LVSGSPFMLCARTTLSDIALATGRLRAKAIGPGEGRLLPRIDSAPVGADQDDVHRIRRDACGEQQIAQQHSAPCGIADRPALPLQALARRLVVNPAIARALHHGSQMSLRHCPQGGEVQAEWLLDRALDSKSPPGALDFGNRKMRADEELVGRDQPLG
jgi:hypothetical protein